jgi:hypothetical protein
MTLKENFGHCIIPKNTNLFRGHNSTDFKDCMFFALKFWVAEAFSNSIQIWKTKTEIEVLFLVEFIDSRSWTKSSIPRLHQMIFPKIVKVYDDLDIKHRSIKRRNTFIKTLNKKYEIQGWFTSLEGAIELEVCLFDSKSIELTEVVERGSDKYPLDSLNQIKLFPTQDFFENTYERIINCSQGTKDKEEARRKYSLHIHELIEEDGAIENIEHQRNKFTNLRTRLNI